MNEEINNRDNKLANEKLIELIKEDLNRLSLLPEEQKIKINEDAKKMISYYNNLTDKVEDRRIKITNSSWQKMTIMVATLNLLYLTKLPHEILCPIILIFIINIIFDIIKLIEYLFQSKFVYPFTDSGFGNRWKWFYYGNEYITKINTNPFISKPNNKEDIENYIKGLHIFLNKYSNETIDKELADNIQQLYLLQVHNYYKNKFYLRLNKYDLYILITSIIVIVIYIIIKVM
jgi:hypothetical protein